MIRVAGRSGREVRPQEAAYSISSAGGKGGRAPIGQHMQPRCVRVSGRAGRIVIGLKEMSSAFKQFGRDLVISEMQL